ncbi:hypothetical protein [Alkalilimnicola sp. S0819]|uniref:hypothetical protein n=1 Tax=Alkalilimnicola sp. S0819 TaxID=2613922 RepID=UPI00126204F4|nr:hypothetical protein [Alkalilimnicola sp. S0819]KAB7623320.1 hypothetical protein F3N43_09445 [Alkalilimnicola sp. S0819]MPQ16858.1 hypothetical protein [Alkalilimnicola sp. S0819]
MDRNWQGDASGQGGVYSPDGADTVSLDYGFVQAPIAGWIVRAGRQRASFAYGFHASDDRRDRISLSRRFGKTVVVALLNKRLEGQLADNDDDRDGLGALGSIRFDNGTDDERSGFVDLQAHYRLSPSTTVWATAGRLEKNPVAGLNDKVTGLSLNLRTQF